MKSLNLFASAGFLAIAAIVSPIATADPAFEVAPVDQNALPGTLLHNPMAIKWNPEGGNKSVSIVDSEGVPGSQAISFRVRKKSRKPWDIRMRAPFERDVSAGDQVDIFFWARTSKLPKKRDTGHIGAAIGRNVDPHDTIIAEEIKPTSEWKMYRVSGTAERDFPTSESDMGFNFGYAKQTVELGPFFAVSRPANAE